MPSTHCITFTDDEMALIRAASPIDGPLTLTNRIKDLALRAAERASNPEVSLRTEGAQPGLNAYWTTGPGSHPIAWPRHTDEPAEPVRGEHPKPGDAVRHTAHLDALPIDSRIADADDDIWIKTTSGWAILENEDGRPMDYPPLAITHIPETTTPQPPTGLADAGYWYRVARSRGDAWMREREQWQQERDLLARHAAALQDTVDLAPKTYTDPAGHITPWPEITTPTGQRLRIPAAILWAAEQYAAYRVPYRITVTPDNTVTIEPQEN